MQRGAGQGSDQARQARWWSDQAAPSALDHLAQLRRANLPPTASAATAATQWTMETTAQRATATAEWWTPATQHGWWATATAPGGGAAGDSTDSAAAGPQQRRQRW